MIRRTSLALLASLLLVACSDDTTPTAGNGGPTAAEPASTAPAVPAPSPAATSSEPAFAADTARDEQAPSGGPLGIRAIRVARQEGYDRVVFELDGRSPGQPGWTVEYVDDPRQDGSGDPVAVEGAATLEVRVSGVGYPMDTGVEEDPKAPAVPRNVQLVEDLQIGSLYEGVYQAFVGVSREAPFRVFRLSDPARVVVDVRHD